MNNNGTVDVLRQRLVKAMEGNESHIDFHSALADFPVEHSGTKPLGVPHSAWELLEHLVISQRDILEFSRNPAEYKKRNWPDDYWPRSDTAPHAEAWNKRVEEFESDRKEFGNLIENSQSDLWKPVAEGHSQTLLREALILANHNSYHLGQLMFLKKMLAAKKET